MDIELEGADSGFEIVDFTTPTDWERLVAGLEDVFRRWKLDTAQALPPEGSPNPLTENVAAGRKKFTLRYHFSLLRQDRSCLNDMLDSLDDFNSYGHPVARWFGFPSFLTLESDHTEFDEAMYLMSSLCIAADNVRVSTPMFVPFGRNRPRDYLGEASSLAREVLCCAV
jgi:hypothetical protein